MLNPLLKALSVSAVLVAGTKGTKHYTWQFLALGMEIPRID
jgi:hypothetical protein